VELSVDDPALDPALPDVVLLGVLAEVSLDVLPDMPPEAVEPVLEPYWRMHWSRSRPVLPRHWLGVVELLPAAAPVLELVLPPTLEPVLGLGELVLEPVLELGVLVLEPVLELGVLIDPLLELVPDAPVPLDCAHEAPATATNAAATAAAIALTITIDSPWSVEEGLRRPTCKSGANGSVVGFRPESRAARGRSLHDAACPHTVSPESHSCPKSRALPVCRTALTTC